MEYILDILHAMVDFLVTFVADMGYFGIILLMLLESSFFPFPSEIVIIPAGYLSSVGSMNIFIVIASGTLGSLLGAILNYFLAFKLGRAFILKYGKFFFFRKKHLDKVELFFDKYGSISTFSARLIFGIRQYVSLPAGLSKMNFFKFCLYTTLGSLIWVSILAVLGYYLAQERDLLKQYLFWISSAFVVIICVIFIYIFIKHRIKNVELK